MPMLLKVWSHHLLNLIYNMLHKMRGERIFVIILILVGFNVALLLSNRNNNATIKLYKKELSKLTQYEREYTLKKTAFDVTMNKNHLLSNLDIQEKSLLEDKKLVFYVPKSACGLCLEKLLNRYWDNYVSKITEQVLVFYENPHLENTYYIGEQLVAHQLIKEHNFQNDDLITIFFLDENQELLNIYLFDVNHIESFEPYIKIFCDHLLVK
jgi:hypothetical protein